MKILRLHYNIFNTEFINLCKNIYMFLFSVITNKETTEDFATGSLPDYEPLY